MARRGTRWAVGGSVLLLVVALVAGAFLLGLDRPGPAPTPDEPVAAPSPSAAPTKPPRMKVARAATLQAAPTCDTGTGGISPTSIQIPGVTGGSGIVTPPRDGNNIPGTPPLSSSGKYLFAWDTAQGTRPGDDTGNVLLNAHTWPDGSALGNAMLAHLDVGGSVVVLGGGKRLCFQVTERVEVLARDGLPRYYDLDGPNQLAILACSGRRLGPGNWEKRTVWFAQQRPA